MSEPFRMPLLGEKERGFTWAPTPEQRLRAERNHSQTLERLRERGGLGWTELYCVIADVDLFSIAHNARNRDLVKAWLLRRYPDALK